MRKAEAKKMKMVYEHEELVNSTLLHTEDVWREVREREREIEFRSKNLTNSEDKLKIAVDRYREKVIKLADLIESETEFITAYNEYISTITDLNISLARLEASTFLMPDKWLIKKEIYRPDLTAISKAIRELAGENPDRRSMRNCKNSHRNRRGRGSNPATPTSPQLPPLRQKKIFPRAFHMPYRWGRSRKKRWRKRQKENFTGKLKKKESGFTGTRRSLRSNSQDLWIRMKLLSSPMISELVIFSLSGRQMDIEKLIREEFSRNIGFLSTSEQKRLLEARVSVAGAGGVGGLHILTLARLGVGKFSIADNDIFEPVNISRQFGATVNTMGRNKAEVMAQMVKEINPYADVRIFQEGINSDNIPVFLKEADIFVDGLDFFEIDIRRLVFKSAREKGIFGVTSAPLGFGATLEVFSPTGMTFDEYFAISDQMEYPEKIAAFAVGLAPHPYHIRYMDMSRVSLTNKTGPALSLACTLAASMVATEVAKILTGKGRVNPVPHYRQIDLFRWKFKQGYVFMGGRNPLQKLKKWIILKKARSINVVDPKNAVTK